MKDDELTQAIAKALVSCARPMPPDLKAALKRRARQDAPTPRRFPLWKAWTAYGLGAAFAAAALLVAVRLCAPQNADTATVVQSFWGDDDGGDRDEG